MRLKKQAMVLLFSFTCLAGQAQGYDSSYRNSYYEQKVSQFRLLPKAKKEIIFLGDSITDIGEWIELWKNRRVRNRGISSDNTFGVLARLDEVTSRNPAKIFLLIGINDIARNIPDSVILRNYARIVQRIRTESPRTRLYVQSILPTNSAFSEYKNHQNKTDHIAWLNAQLRSLCKRTEAIFVDLHSAFADGEGKLDRQYTNDGLHLTGAGYRHWQAFLEKNGYLN